MDLKKWNVFGSDKSVADYDSTKAALDNLEGGQEEIKRWYKKCLERLEFHDHEPPLWTRDFNDRLTALEAKDAPEKLMICPDCYGYGRDIFRKAVLEETCPTCHGLGKVNSIPTPTCGNCTKAWRRDKDKGLVLCRELPNVTFSSQYKANEKPACPDHERREEA